MNRQKFAVDAALLQELGDRLIGKAHIALAELIKNGYDADANVCEIKIEHDRIVIADNGHGMSKDEFLDHWMRIGTTHKVDQITSRTLKRTLTGSKGIGRLSAQFLAREMTIESVATAHPDELLFVVVDWRQVDRGEDLSIVEVEWEMRSERIEFPDHRPTGTRIELRDLKTAWDADAIRSLGEEIWLLRSPFAPVTGTGAARGADDFIVEIEAPSIENARVPFDKMLRILRANWRARVTGHLENGMRGDKAIVTVEFKAGYPDGIDESSVFVEQVEMPLNRETARERPLVNGTTFEILIFRATGRQEGGLSVNDMREYLRKFGNVSVYDAGFRLPYYGVGSDETGQDWLNVARDHGRRLSVSSLLPDRLNIRGPYMEDLPAAGRLLGTVEVDTNGERAAAQETDDSPAEWLQIQSGRDRLQTNRAFFQLRDLVRFSLDLYASRFRALSLRAAESTESKEPPTRKYDRAVQALDRAKASMPRRAYSEARREIVAARRAASAEEKSQDMRAALLAPLAAAGMTALAFSHELARQSQMLSRMGTKLRRLGEAPDLTDLEAVALDFEVMRGRFDSLQELFAPLLSGEDRVALDRLRARPLVEQVVRAMRPLLPRVDIDVRGVSPDLYLPTGSFAEWNALLQNVLANAWNAMLDSRRSAVSFDGDRPRHGRAWLRVSDTGQGLGLPLKETPQLFEPFERRMTISDDNRSIAMGGQGLGLTIVRMIARRRAARVRFIKPLKGYTTTFEMSWNEAGDENSRM